MLKVTFLIPLHYGVLLWLADHEAQAEEYISEAVDKASSPKPLHPKITEAAELAKLAAKGFTLCHLSSAPLEMKRAGAVTDPFCAIQTACDVTQKRTQPLDSSGLSKSIPSHRDSFNTKKRQMNTLRQQILIKRDKCIPRGPGNLWKFLFKIEVTVFSGKNNYMRRLFSYSHSTFSLC